MDPKSNMLFADPKKQWGQDTKYCNVNSSINACCIRWDQPLDVYWIRANIEDLCCQTKRNFCEIKIWGSVFVDKSMSKYSIVIFSNFFMKYHFDSAFGKRGPFCWKLKNVVLEKRFSCTFDLKGSREKNFLSWLLLFQGSKHFTK